MFCMYVWLSVHLVFCYLILTLNVTTIHKMARNQKRTTESKQPFTAHGNIGLQHAGETIILPISIVYMKGYRQICSISNHIFLEYLWGGNGWDTKLKALGLILRPVKSSHLVNEEEAVDDCGLKVQVLEPRPRGATMSVPEEVGDVLPPLLKMSVSLMVAAKESGERTTDPGVMLGSSSILFIWVP